MAEKKKTNKINFEVNGKEYSILRPKSVHNEAASMEYNRVFSNSLKSGALLRESLDKFMREQELWNDEKQKLYTDLLVSITEKERILAKGGIKLSEARDHALQIKSLRTTLQALIAEKNALDVNTAQGQAENARFNCLLINCLVYNDTGEPVFSSIDEYDSSDNADLTATAAERFANMYFGLDNDYESNLPENKFLKQYSFIDDENRLINKDGKLIDVDGRLIDEEGRYINEEGKFIDFFGNLLSEDGEYIFDSSPFLDDEGNKLDKSGTPIITEETEKPKATAKKRRGRPPKKKAEEVSSD
tara:strand:- start:546 stop:1451 length:906 start_codon:yes stop_codon:yes gene_type:complete